MATREQLRQGGMRAYERGRIAAAAQVAWFLVPAAVLCGLTTGAGETCACLAVVLLGSALYLRWRDRRGEVAVTAGLAAGALPLIAGLVLGLSPACANAPLVSVCTAVCLGVGLPSGLWLGVRTARGKLGLTGMLTAAGIAVLAASLGCAGLGVVSIAATAGGLLIGSAAAMIPVRSA